MLESRGNSRNNTPQQNTNNINANKNNISFSSPQLFLNLKSPSSARNQPIPQHRQEVEEVQQENVPTYEARLSLGLGLASVDETNQKNSMEVDDDDVPTFNVRFSSGFGGRHSPRFSTGGQL